MTRLTWRSSHARKEALSQPSESSWRRWPSTSLLIPSALSLVLIEPLNLQASPSKQKMMQRRSRSAHWEGMQNRLRKTNQNHDVHYVAANLVVLKIRNVRVIWASLIPVSFKSPPITHSCIWSHTVMSGHRTRAVYGAIPWSVNIFQ